MFLYHVFVICLTVISQENLSKLQFAAPQLNIRDTTTLEASHTELGTDSKKEA
jgi:hypothetical protein